MGLGKVFERWANFVIRCPILTLVVALLCYGYAATGIRFKANYKFSNGPFTPEVRKQVCIFIMLGSSACSLYLFYCTQGSPTIEALKKTYEGLTYQARQKKFQVIVEAKRDGGSLLTLDSFQEMIELDHMIKNDVNQIMPDILDKNENILLAGGYDAYYADICKKFVPWTGSQDSPDSQTDAKIVSIIGRLLAFC